MPLGSGAPTYAYARMLYKYPHAAYPYARLVRECRTDLDPRHEANVTGAWMPRPNLAAVCARDLIDSGAVHLLRTELQLEALAHHTSKKAAHRMLLPTRGDARQS